jgi:low molecular weight protein-tyrosine phosphatase
MNYVSRQFANHRGLIRTVLADIMWRLGPYRKYGQVDWSNVRRLVFICQGNICRSPFAHFLAVASEPVVPVTSFGLATSTGVPANSSAIDVAADYGLDMSAHSATDISDFVIEEGDLLIVMEDRHVTQLQQYITGRKVQVCLLGLWCRPRFALLYDPFGHPRQYFSACFDRIDRAVVNLMRESQEFSLH